MQPALAVCRIPHLLCYWFVSGRCLCFSSLSAAEFPGGSTGGAYRVAADKLSIGFPIITLPSNTLRDVVCSAVISWNVICWWDVIVLF